MIATLFRPSNVSETPWTNAYFLPIWHAIPPAGNEWRPSIGLESIWWSEEVVKCCLEAFVRYQHAQDLTVFEQSFSHHSLLLLGQTSRFWVRIYRFTGRMSWKYGSYSVSASPSFSQWYRYISLHKKILTSKRAKLKPIHIRPPVANLMHN